MVKQTKTTKKKKKQWFEIIAPKLFNESVIGETLAYDVKDTVGRNLSLSLMHLTHNPKKFYVNIKFEITNAAENKAFATIIGYDLSPSYIKRLVRKGTKKIDDSFLVKSKSGILEVKPTIITDGTAKFNVRSALRKKVREFFADFFIDKNIDEIVKLLIKDEIQNELKKLLNKIYPIKFSEVRSLKLVKTKFNKKRLVEAKPKIKSKKEEGAKNKEKTIAESKEKTKNKNTKINDKKTKV